MASAEQIAFGKIFDALARGLPDGWEMNVGTLTGTEPAVRFRAMASNPRTDDVLVLYGPNELVAVTRLREALASYRSVR